ncbi:MAG: PD-(D/E)XK nuclease family protein [Clostridia bacterium]|nr:PD-(D/E)XK nuclease family protein [Clostridia bacterium]
MLNLVLGRSGCGKTEYLRSVLRSRAVSGDSKLLLIVPEQFSFESERSFLLSMRTEDAQKIEVLSFTRLYNYVGRTLGGLSGVTANNGIKIIVMLRALEGLSDSLEWYSSHIRSVSLAKELVSLISEFRKERITPEALREVSKKTPLNTLKTKLGEIALIYEAYDALFAKTYVDEDTAHERLIKSLKENRFFEGYTICIDAFKGFTGQEYEILKHIISQADEVYLSLTLDNIHHTESTMIFGSVKDTARHLERIAKETNAGVKIVKKEEAGLRDGARFESKELAFLEENLFSPSPKKYEAAEENEVSQESITLVTAATIHDECKFIASTVRKLIRENGLKLSEVAVVVRNEEEYSSELRSALKHCDIPVFEDKRQPVSSQPLMCCCKSVLEILKNGFTTENILRYLKSGLSPLTERETAELENYALMWNLHARDWISDFEASPAGMDELTSDEAKAYDKNRLKELNESRKKAIEPLLLLKKRTSDTTSHEISEVFYDFLLKTDVPDKLKVFASALNENGFTALACEQDRVWDILMDILSSLSSIYGETKTDITTYENLFSAVLSVTDIGSIPHTLDELIIGSADRIRLSNPKVVFVAGCAEGVFPAVWQDSGILSSNDRKLLSSLGLPLGLSYELKACEEYFIAYSALTSATERVYVSYHRTDTDGSSLMPSVIFENLKELFSENIRITDVDDLSPVYFSETAISSFFAYAENYGLLKGKDEERIIDLNSIRDVFSGSLFENRFKVLDRVSQKRTFKIEDEEISTELFGKNMFLSASRVDVYHKCPFEYFCKYGLRAMPAKRAELDSALGGTVIHFVLEQIIGESGKEGILAFSEEELKDTVNKWLDIYLNDYIGGTAGKTDRFLYLYNRLSRSLYDIVKRLRDEFTVSDFIPCDFELPIDNKAAESNEGVPSYTLNLPDGGTLEIHGSVDRVDKYEKDGITYIRIVDYKSGGKDFVLSDILYGLNMQMLIYLFAIEAGGAQRYGDIRPAGIMYYPAKRTSVNMSSRNMTPEKVEKLKLQNDLGSGLFLLDKNTLCAMEKDIGGRYIPITVKSNKKDGTDELKGNLITAEYMGKLRRRIDEILCRMAENLHQGVIPAQPVHENSRYKNTCKYCDYFSVCGTEGEDIREIKNFTNNEVFDELDTEEGENNE